MDPTPWPLSKTASQPCSSIAPSGSFPRWAQILGKSVTEFEKSKVCLTEARTDAFLGFVLVNLNPDAKPMDDWFPNTRVELESFGAQWVT
ncbi:MAG: hypothetical protein ABJX32_02925 [Tateyamaria sp.]|uniref:hypothetical protein n=1 Tax=Tateyamaria sp. TaxID=1929288 RepID=UPI00329F391C